MSDQSGVTNPGYSGSMLLQRLQALLASLYDAPVAYDAQDFLITDRHALNELVGAAGERADGSATGLNDELSDEQVFVVHDRDGVRIGLYIDAAVIARLAHQDPTVALDGANLHDFCTALEGVSHFHYLAWSLQRGREVSLLELELQAEVDKYASALTLMTRQHAGRFPSGLHSRLFDRISFLPHLDAASRRRYEEANRHAARFCRSLEERFLRCRQLRPEAWLSELRRFFRCSHQEKIRQLAV
jgi:hypothetical protein